MIRAIGPLVLLGCLLGGLAQGQELTEQNRELAKPLTQEATRAYERGEYRRAQNLLEAAFRVYPSDKIQYTLGCVYEALADWTAAIAAYERYLRGVPEAERVPGRTEEVRAALLRLRARLGPPPLRAPMVAPAPRVAVSPPAAAPRPAPRRRPAPMRVAKWVTGAVGLVAIAVGTALLLVDGMGTCDLAPGQRQCPEVLDTQAAGIATLTGGLLAASSSAVLFGLDYRRSRGEGQTAMLAVTARF